MNTRLMNQSEVIWILLHIICVTRRIRKDFWLWPTQLTLIYPTSVCSWVFLIPGLSSNNFQPLNFQQWFMNVKIDGTYQILCKSDKTKWKPRSRTWNPFQPFSHICYFYRSFNGVFPTWCKQGSICKHISVVATQVRHYFFQYIWPSIWSSLFTPIWCEQLYLIPKYSNSHNVIWYLEHVGCNFSINYPLNFSNSLEPSIQWLIYLRFKNEGIYE